MREHNHLLPARVSGSGGSDEPKSGEISANKTAQLGRIRWEGAGKGAASRTAEAAQSPGSYSTLRALEAWQRKLELEQARPPHSYSVDSSDSQILHDRKKARATEPM